MPWWYVMKSTDSTPPRQSIKQYKTTRYFATSLQSQTSNTLWLLYCVVAVSVPCQDQDKVWTTDNFFPSSVSLPECHIYYFSVFQTLQHDLYSTFVAVKRSWQFPPKNTRIKLPGVPGWWISNWNEVIVGYVSHLFTPAWLCLKYWASSSSSQLASQYHINTDPPPSLWSFILTIRVRDLEKIIKQN